MRDEQQVWSMGNEPMNAPIIKVSQQIEVEVQHQNVIEQVVHMKLATPSNTYQVTPQISSQ
jgi:hypothetical protein